MVCAVYALEITVGGTLGNVSATDFLNIANSSVVTTVSTSPPPDCVPTFTGDSICAVFSDV